ncbi:MAG: hypothetical protein JNN18_23710 [Rubrivivax sp.]|nr:hypothetical protein [Rubrivivax sp.]
MDTTDLARTADTPVLVPTIITFGVTDQEVLQALAEYPEGPARAQFLATALKVGVLALKAARGTLDSDAVRREGDRLLDELGSRLNAWRGKLEERVTGSLSHYFDPKSGTFMERVERLTRADGDLATVVGQQVRDAQQSLAKVFEQFVGENSELVRLLDPSGENQLVGTLQRTLDGAVRAQNEAILRQFSLDNRDGALVRFLGELNARHGDLNQALSRNLQAVVSEFSLDREDSALSRLVQRVEAAQSSLTAELSLDNEGSALQRLQRMLHEHQKTVLAQQRDLAARLDTVIESMAARRAEAAKGTRHGFEFEATLGDHLRRVVGEAGDILQDTGTTTGVIPNCKVGDHVITIGPEKTAAGARIVVEAKESASHDLVRTLEEADLARRNRQSGVCIVVHSTKTAPASIPDFRRYGHDIVVRWDADDDAHDVWLEAALMVATALSARAASHEQSDAASFAKIDKAIERIRKALETFDEINKSANTAKSAAEKILERARIMQSQLADQVEAIMGEFGKLKGAQDGG